MSCKNSVKDSELYSYDYFFLEYVCRLCWGTDGTVEITSFSPKSMERDSTIAEKIQECVGIDVTRHSHPKKVCSKCLNELEIFTEFKRFCLESDRKLHDILQKGASQDQVPPTADLEIENEDKSDEAMILKEETDLELSNFELDDSIDDLFDDVPLSCEISGNFDVRPAKKGRKKRPITYCKLCRLKLESKEKFKEHNFEFHGVDENGMYKCFGCDKKFTDTKKRMRHECETCKELKSGYKCNICNTFLPKRRSYEHHMKLHRENKLVNSDYNEIDLPNIVYKCNKCMKPFDNTERLREHMITHYHKEREKRTYVCDICGRVFTRRDYLHKHKLIHEGSKLQKCPHCDYSAIQRSSLTVHLRKHTGDRPYACDLCPHRCITSSNLREHRKRHFGIKAFECKLCEKKFGYKISLEEHMSAVHERSESHTCAQCGASYSRFRGLRRHLLAKHGKKVKKVKDNLVEVQNETVEGTKGDVKENSVVNQNESAMFMT